MNNMLCILLCSGIGSRVQESQKSHSIDQNLPKQFQKIFTNDNENSKQYDCIDLCLKTFEMINLKTIIISNAEYIDISKNKKSPIILKVIQGSKKSRQESSYIGVKDANELGFKYVMIHDCARPFVTVDLIKKLYKNVIQFNNAVPCVTINDLTINQNNQYSISRAIQTPQAFDAKLILKAHEKAQNSSFKDESSMYNKILGLDVNFIQGEYNNIKITQYKDIEYAKYLYRTWV